eukprot:scaffold194606_cov23-Tisochrysis_lutea.AAC.1
MIVLADQRASSPEDRRTGPTLPRLICITYQHRHRALNGEGRQGVLGGDGQHLTKLCQSPDLR